MNSIPEPDFASGNSFASVVCPFVRAFRFPGICHNNIILPFSEFISASDAFRLLTLANLDVGTLVPSGILDCGELEEGECPRNDEDEMFPRPHSWSAPALPVQSLAEIAEEDEDDDHPDPLTWEPEKDDDDDHPDPLTWEPEEDNDDDHPDPLTWEPEKDEDDDNHPDPLTWEPEDEKQLPAEPSPLGYEPLPLVPLDLDLGPSDAYQPIMYEEAPLSDDPSSEASGEPTRAQLLANLPILRKKLSLQDSLNMALYALGGKGTTSDVRNWIRENDFAEALNMGGRVSGLLERDKAWARPFWISRVLDRDVPVTQRVYRLTKAGTAHCEAMLGSRLLSTPFSVIQHMPLASRVRYVLANYGAQTRSQFVAKLGELDLLLTADASKPNGSRLGNRAVESGLSNLCFGAEGSLFCVDNYAMNRCTFDRQWAVRFVPAELAALGMSVLRPALWFFASNDFQCSLSFQLIPGAEVLGNFLSRVAADGTPDPDGSHYRAEVALPEGTLIPAQLLVRSGERTPLGKFRADFSLCEFQFIPGLEGQCFYMAKKAVRPGEYLHLSGLVQSQPEPCKVARKMSSREKTKIAAQAIRLANGQDLKAARPTPQSRKQTTSPAKAAPVVPKKVNSRSRQDSGSTPKRRRRSPGDEVASIIAEMPAFAELDLGAPPNLLELFAH